MTFDIQALQSYIASANGVIALIKSAAGFLPKSEKQAADDKIREAEQALAAANAQLAKSLNYQLCQCTFPPSIMLWRHTERAFLCDACGYRNEIGPHEQEWVSGVP
ncbi:MAG: hypothetical protein ABL883_12145 [Terricaulis sp.]